MKIVTIDQMRELEARADRELGMSSPILMEYAGRSAADLLLRWAGEVRDKNILLLIGPGNNGGDGLVIARHLKSWGARITLYRWKEGQIVLGGLDDLTIPARDDLKHLRVALASADRVVDALLGTGRSRPLDPTMRQALGMVREERERRPDLRVWLSISQRA